jgi:ABC-2 type transport system ATP-binding protein
VANGTPQELKKRSEFAGTAIVRVNGATSAVLTQKLSQLPAIRKTALIKEENNSVVVRAYPNSRVSDGELSRSIFETAKNENWNLEDLHIDEGKLDEVFRSITLPETNREGRQ